MMLKTLIVDDEPLARELVEDYVRQVDFIELTGVCSSASEAQEFLNNKEVDLIFLDVQMPGMSGLTFAKNMEVSQKPKIVFTTAYEEYALDGYRVNAVDYLLKPFDFDEFTRAVNKVKHLVELESGFSSQQNPFPQSQDSSSISDPLSDDEKRFFFVKSEYKLVKIEIEKVLYIEGLKDYVKIFIADLPKPVLTLSTMKQMEAKLEAHAFVRLHRSFIVNVNKITGAERNGVYVGNTRIPVSDGYKTKFQETISKLTL